MTKEEVYAFVKPCLVDKSLLYDDFDKIFWFLNQKEQYKVVETLLELHIELVDQILKDDIGEENEVDISDKQYENIVDDIDIEGLFVDDKEYKLDENELNELTMINTNIKQSNDILCKLIQEGNKQAEQDLCIKNEKLVNKYVVAYLKMYGNTLEFEDLKQSGMMGMIKAAKRFDYQMGTSFSTYAVYWIKQSISREIMDHGFVVRIPVHLMEKIAKFSRLDKLYTREGLDYKKRKKVIADELGLTEEAINRIIVLKNQYLSIKSLDAPVGEEGDITLGSLVVDSNCLLPEESVEQIMLRNQLDELLGDLKDREKEILILRFGLRDGHSRTLEEIGNIYDLTRERIRQIEEKALKKLRNPVRSKKIKDYLYD